MLTAFESIDRPAMKPLPPTRYEYAEWSKAKVGIDYHVEGDRHYYSVPHTLVGEHVMVRLTATTVECFFKGRRVAAHVRSYLKGRHTTLPEHMPSSHRRHMKWTPGRLLNWGQKIGAGTRAVVQWQLENRPHPEQGYRACLGLLNLPRPTARSAWRRPAAGRSPSAHHTANASSRSSKPSSTSIRTSSPRPTRRLPRPRARTATCAAPITSVTQQPVRETTTTDEGDDESCLSNPPSIH